jgi:membrane-bound ClpP family serine protease
MSLVLIMTIIAVGIIFIFVEFFFIPGFSVFSILGAIVAGIGVYMGYQEYGQATGNWLLTASIVATGVVFYWGYKRMQSKKWALKTEIDGKVNVEDFSNFKLGDRGLTITNLRPEGKALFGEDDRITVYSIGDFIDKDAKIEIIKIEHNKIFVQSIN